MPDADPAQQQAGTGGEPAVESSDDWAALDRLISWAIAQGDAAVDEICRYLTQRLNERRAQAAHELLPDWARTYSRRSVPYRGRGRDQACSQLRRRLRAHHGDAQRPIGAERPPRLRRTSG
jgi:hypothetical protein